MRSRAAAAFLAVTVVGLLAIAIVAATDERDLAFSLGVAPGMVAAELAPGDEACQTPVPVAEPFSGVRMQIGTYRRLGAPLRVSVRDAESGRLLAAGRLAAGYPDVSQETVALDRTVRAGELVAVCVRNEGRRRTAIYGGSELARRRSTVEVEGRDQRTDLTLVFTAERRSVAAQVPRMLERAALFRPQWAGAWLYWLLLALIIGGIPLLLAAALTRAFASEADGDGSERRLGGGP